MALPELVPVHSAEDALGARWDGVVLVTPDPRVSFGLEALKSAVTQYASLDAEAASRLSLVRADEAPGRRIVISPTGDLSRDFDDVRRFGDAARAGLARVRDAGAKRPILIVDGVPTAPRYLRTVEVSVLDGLAGLWQPLEAREARGESEIEPVEQLAFLVADAATGRRIQEVVSALEAGRRLARDLCGTEPERMAPEGFAAYTEAAMQNAPVSTSTERSVESILERYPLLSSVSRGSTPVPRHHPRVVRLEYTGDGPVERTLLFAGKGVTYDTGGLDIKAGGHMSGMSRDKGGAAAVAGFIKTVAMLAPRGLRVVAELGLVRNSVGAEAFASDEIITAHSGCRVRIGNTDAEGRLVMADLLSHLREDALSATQPSLFTVATLTGHAGRAYGPYSIALDNGPARDRGTAECIAEAGEVWGDPFELSRLRREDWDFVQPRTPADDVLSANNGPSTATNRGHQFPAAFLLIASGLSQHMSGSARPLPFTHIDIGGSAARGGDWQHGHPTAAPVSALAGTFLDI